MQRPARVLTFLVLILATPTFTSPAGAQPSNGPVGCLATPSAPFEIATLDARLPTSRGWTAPVWTGNEIVVVGGATTRAHPEILRFDPCTETLRASDSPLSPPRFGVHASWDGDEVVLVAGDDGSRLLDQVEAYSPDSDSLALRAPRTPGPMRGAAVVNAGASTYLFGGEQDGGRVLDSILRLDHATGSLTTLEARLPQPRTKAAAAWDGERILILGGDEPSCPERACASIFVFEPGSMVTWTASQTLPEGRLGAVAFADAAGAVHLLGGCTRVSADHCSATDSIVIVRAIEGGALGARAELGVAVSATRLPAPRMMMGLAWTGNDAYLFGGQSDWQGSTTTDEILRYHPPIAAVATAQTEADLPFPGTAAAIACGLVASLCRRVER